MTRNARQALQFDVKVLCPKQGAGSTMQTLFYNIKCVGKRKQGVEGEREGALL